MLRRRGTVMRLATGAAAGVGRRARPWPPSTSSSAQPQQQAAHGSSLRLAARGAPPPPPPLAARPPLASLPSSGLTRHAGAAALLGQQARGLHDAPPLQRRPPAQEPEQPQSAPPSLALLAPPGRPVTLYRWGNARAGASLSLLGPSSSSSSSSYRPFSSQPARPAGSPPPPAAAASTASDKATPPAAPATATPTPQGPRYVEEGFNPQDLKPEAGVEDPRKEENSPSTVGGVLRRYSNKALAALMALPGAVYSFTVWAGKWLVSFVVETAKNPASLREKWVHVKKVTVEEFHHYKVGSKVLWADMKTSWSIVRRLLQGHTLSRRERRQLTRTTADLFRLVPFAFFVIVPFMELLLPFALKLFPNMLPSTFQDSLKTEENMKRELKVRLALAGFLKDTLTEITNKKVKGKESPNAALLNEFVEKARAGTHISTTEIQRFARLFKDELTLDNMSRPQLAGMCVYMGLRPYGSDNFLRFQLRAKLRSLKEDDQRIVWEGVDNMTKSELREACRERGMRAYGLTQLGYRRQLQQWLDLSINKEVPISLLILSRAFTLDSKFADPAAAVADSISSLDKDVVDEVILDVASGAELRNPELRAKKLESIERQNELIQAERKREEARRKKQQEEEERRRKAKEEEEKAAKAAGTPADAAAKPAEVPSSDTKAVQEAAARAAAMTAPDGQAAAAATAAVAAAVKKAEALPSEKVLTEAQIVGAALPSLGGEEKKQAPSSSAQQQQPPVVGAEAGAEAGAGAGKGEEEKQGKGAGLSREEVKALRTLVKESSVEQEKTVLAQLKAELQAASAAKAKAAAAAAAAASSAGAAGKEKEGAGKGEGAPAEAAAAAAPASSAPAAVADVAQPAEAMRQAAVAAAAAVATPASKLEAVLTAESGTVAAAAGVGAKEASAPSAAEAPAAGKAEAGGAPAEAAAAAAKAAAMEEEEEEEEEHVKGPLDKSVERMRLKVASMLDKLEHDIEKVESTIGDKLHMLDKDKDGVLSTAELSEVIFHVLKRHNSEEEALKIAAEMDKDADGILTVEELMDWIAHKEELLDELGNENDDAPSPPPSPPPTPKPAAAPAAAAAARSEGEGTTTTTSGTGSSGAAPKS